MLKIAIFGEIWSGRLGDGIRYTLLILLLIESDLGAAGSLGRVARFPGGHVSPVTLAEKVGKA